VPHHEHEDDDREHGQLRRPSLPDEAGGAQAELLLGQQVGQVGDGQQEGGRVGQPDRRERERQRAQAELGGQGEPDGGQQHRGGVDAEHPGRDGGQRREQQEQREPVAAGDPSGQVRAHVEQSRVVAQVGDHLDQHQEQQDRPDALSELEKAPAQRPNAIGADW
jgi:hypothetical protein